MPGRWLLTAARQRAFTPTLTGLGDGSAQRTFVGLAWWLMLVRIELAIGSLKIC